MAAAALAAGAYSAAHATGGTMPWAHTGSDVAASTEVASDVINGQAGTTIVDAFTGHKSAAAAQAIRLDAWDVPKTGGTAASPGTASTAAPASAWASGLARIAVAKPPAATPVSQAPASEISAARTYAAQAAAAQATAAKPQAAPAHSAAAKPAAHIAPVKTPPIPLPFTLYDSVTPSTIPQGKHVATYVNGNYAASAASVAGRGPVLWIDTNGSDPRANVLDVEPGDATPPGAAQWVQQKLTSQPNSVAIVYTMQSEWQAVKDNIDGLPSWMQARVRYWIADPTGIKHMVPGSSATQWYWGQNYDISAANGNFETP